MTVYSINKRALEQATNMTPVGTKTEDSAAADFAALLNNAGLRFGGGGTVASAEKSLGKSLDRPVKEAREDKPAEKAERPAAKQDDRPARRTEGKKVERADKSEPRDKAPVKEAKAETAATDDDAPVETAAAATASDDDTVTTDTQAAAATDTAGEQLVVAETNNAQQPVTQVAQAAAEVVVEAVAETGGEQQAGETTGQNAQAAAQAETGDDTAAQAAADAAADAALDTAQAATTANAGKTDTHSQTQQQAATEVVQQQADDMAEMLSDTGAQLSVQVSVTNAQTDAADTQAADLAASLDVALAQDVALTETAATGQQTGGQTTGESGGQNQGVANAAQQVDPALENVLAANGKATEAKPFAAALAAQAEAAPTQGANGAAQPGPAVTGLGSATGTQAAAKAQAPQAAQAPRQPLPTPQQVMDQVSVQISKAAKDGHDTIKVQLKPVELGSIEVKLDIGKDGNVTGVVTADNKDTLAMLQKDSRGLEKALSDAGFKADSGSLTFNLREGAQQQANNNGAQNRGRRPRMASALGGLDATAAAAAQPRWNGSRSGVDIKV